MSPGFEDLNQNFITQPIELNDNRPMMYAVISCATLCKITVVREHVRGGSSLGKRRDLSRRVAYLTSTVSLRVESVCFFFNASLL